jgi:hypothetical protein
MSTKRQNVKKRRKCNSIYPKPWKTSQKCPKNKTIIIIVIGTQFEINTQLRMRIIHNWKVEWIFRLFKAIISIYSIIKIYRFCPTLLWRTINLGRQISDISKKSMQATIYCHYD